MNRMTAAALRQLFLDFFKSHGHAVVKSSPLVPANDPTLMFTNAGMVQFKDVFVGAESRPYKRATTCQKVMRVSGKHNDLEEVGRTARHHTFFEMLGNFSFGDYFKEDAIKFGWDFITKDVGLNKDKLWITVFGGAEGMPADNEAAELWQKITGLPRERIIGKGMKDNFWSMGDVGPCGPCTEIHYDQGSSGTPTEADFDNGRVMEIWNLVFMQFERQAGGKLLNLPAPSVDTGLGLERLIALVQGVDSNYHSDLFMPLLDTIAHNVGKPYQKSASEDDVSMRVIADHARTTAFLSADGVQPSNEGRGYVMRRIMRRAIRHGKRLGFNDLFFHTICDQVVQNMSGAYPELTEARSLIGKVAQLEEEGFRRTLDTGLKILGDEIQTMKSKKQRAIAGDVVFKLYDTYGFPKDLTEVIAQEQGLTVDEDGFTRSMEAQKERSRGGDVGQAAVAGVHKQLAQRLGPLPFVGYPAEEMPLTERPGTWRQSEYEGYATLEVESTVRALIQEGAEVQSIDGGDAEVVLDPTPFYGESGGQVGDAGRIVIDEQASAQVLDTQRPLDNLTVCKVRMTQGALKVGDKVWAGYYPASRRETRAHHSATHLLHGALRKVLGEHVKQAGSLVDAHHLRFDFSHFSALTPQEVNAVERDVQRRIDEQSPIVTEELSFDEAKTKGAIAMFGEKYGDQVRVLSMGESVEFCGGTHAANTKDIGLLLIAREEAVQSGVRRVLAEVSQAVYRRVQSYRDRLDEAVNLMQGKDMQSEGSPEGESSGGDSEPVLAAIAKLFAQKESLTEQLKAMGTVPITEAPAATLKPWPAPMTPTIGLPEAQALRDTWNCVVQLVNGRVSDIPQVLERFGSLDRDRADILPHLTAVLQGNREMERVLETERRKAQTSQAGDLMREVKTIGTTPVLMTQVDNVEGAALRELADALRSKLPSGIVCIGARNGDKCALLITVSKDLTGKLAAGKLVQSVAALIEGRGGGKPEMAQAGGQKPDGLPQAFAALETQISQAG